ALRTQPLCRIRARAVRTERRRRARLPGRVAKSARRRVAIAAAARALARLQRVHARRWTAGTRAVPLDPLARPQPAPRVLRPAATRVGPGRARRSPSRSA